MNDLVSLISDLMGPALANAPDVFRESRWYPIPDLLHGGGATALNIVATSPKETSGQIGFGFVYPVGVGDMSATPPTLWATCWLQPIS